MLGSALVATSVAAAGWGMSWIAWSRILSLLLLPAQLVYAFRQKILEDTRTKFLEEHKNARRVKIDVKAPKGKIPTSLKEVVDIVQGRVHRDSSPSNEIVVGTLDGVEVPFPKSRDEVTRWYLHLNANGVCYEEKLPSVLYLQDAFEKQGYKLNFLLVNYRGVGHSTGQVLCGNDLIADGTAALRYLVESRGVRPQDILVHGHSIGGASAVMSIGGMLDSNQSDEVMHVKDPALAPFLLADRTFADLSNVVKDKLNVAVDMGPIGALMLGNVAALLLVVNRLGLGNSLQHTYLVSAISLVFLPVSSTYITEIFTGPMWPAATEIEKQTNRQTKQGMMIALRLSKVLIGAAATNFIVKMTGPSIAYGSLVATIGFFLGQAGHLNYTALSIVRFIGWTMDVSPAWNLLDKDGRALVTYHDGDEMIPSDVSLATLHDRSKCLPLAGTQGSCHMYELFMHPHERVRIFERLEPFFNKK